jgi:hypothetical protein
MIGQCIKSIVIGPRIAGENEYHLDLAGIPQGLFLLQVVAGKATLTSKLAIEK